MRTAIIALLGAAAVWFAFTGLTPWPAIGVFWALLTAQIAHSTSWTFGVAASSVTTLAGAAVLIQLTPLLGASLATATLTLLAIGIAALTLASAFSPWRMPRASSLALGAAAGALPTLTVLAAILSGALGRLGYSWAMHNDAVWNLIVARFVIDDGGVRSDIHPNPSPMSPGLIAVVAGIGRDQTSAARLLEHDVSRAAELWLVVAVLGALIAGLVCVVASRGLPLTLRMPIAVIGSAVPLGGYTFGNALAFGFYNATIALTLLLATWLLWAQGRRSPLATLGFLSFALVALLATWGPLAIVVVPFLALALVAVIRERRRLRSWAAVAAGAAVILAVTYGGLITLPDLRRQSGALAADGGIFELSPARSAVLVGCLSAALIVSAVVTRDRRIGLGVAALLASSAAGLGYLLLQRSGEAARLWGYYPTKFTWLIVSLMLLLVIAALAAFIAWAQLRGRGIPSAFAGLGVLGALVLALGGFGAPSLPVADIVRGGEGLAASDDAARTLFAVTTPGQVSVASRLSSRADDQFMNHWSLQLEAKNDEDPIRWWAYFLDPESDSDVCAAAADAKEPLVVFTSDPHLGARLDCDVSVEIPDPLAR